MRKPGSTVDDDTRRRTMMSNPWRKQLITPDGTFASVKAASRALGISLELISYRCDMGERQRAALAAGKKRPGYKDFTGWQKVNTAARERGLCRPVRTPAGVFPSVKAAAQHYQITSAAIIQKIRSYPEQFSYED